MKKKSKETKKFGEFEIKKFGEEIRNHFDVVAEEMKTNIQLIAEGQQIFREEVDRRFNKVDKRFDEHDQMFSEINSNLKTALGYLFRIDEEITQIKAEIKEMKKKDKISESWMASIEKRVGFIEKQLKIQKQTAR